MNDQTKTTQSVDGSLDAELPYQVVEHLDGVGPAGTQGGGPGPVGPVVARELRNILGFAPTSKDLAGTERALAAAFQRVVENGISRVEYARGAGVLLTEAGPLTGAQGALYSQANLMIAEMQELLADLKPMTEEVADRTGYEAIRSIVSSEIKQIGEAIGLEQGPNVVLIDGLWQQLLGGSATHDPAKLEGDLGLLRDRFYVDEQWVATVDDEENYTKFLTLVDHVVCLYESWDRKRQAFGNGDSLGIGLGRLRLELQNIAEDVDALTGALDAVNVTQAERQLIRVDTVGGPLYLQQTLDWIRQFSGEEAPELIGLAGKDGAIAMHGTLCSMLKGIDVLACGPKNPPAFYDSPLVKAAFASLRASLGEAVLTTEAVGATRPVFVEVSPAAAVQGIPEPCAAAKAGSAASYGSGTQTKAEMVKEAKKLGITGASRMKAEVLRKKLDKAKSQGGQP